MSEMKIQRSQTIADQVLALLRQRIRDGYYGAEYRIPSESELAAELGVSRATIRNALSTLASERLITRRQGDGTYINRRFLDTTIHFGAIVDFTTMITATGHTPSIRALSIDTRACTETESEALQIPVGSTVKIVKRLFYSDGSPAIYSINVIPESILCQPLELSQLEEPLPVFFKRLCGQEFTYGISDLCAKITGPEVGRNLEIDDHQPIVCMLEVFYNVKDEPLVSAINYFNDAVLQLRVARSFG